MLLKPKMVVKRNIRNLVVRLRRNDELNIDVAKMVESEIVKFEDKLQKFSAKLYKYEDKVMMLECKLEDKTKDIHGNVQIELKSQKDEL